MVIKRKYATYGQLMDDKLSRDAIIKAMVNSGWSEANAINHINEYLRGVFVFSTDLGSGLGASFAEIKKALKELDESEPFENGLTYNDVTRTDSFSSKKGNAVVQVLISQRWDMQPLIVQVVAFEKEGNGIKVIKPWDVGEIII